ncbi:MULTISPECIES: LysR substrate-binding domain-containing protein [Thalassotalea]|uniref:LysR substrate-binding domain-containing protein n=1 Tax=Thalassotalea castellviae TaxID=3075612 RepID=A0ABU3A4V6_9GAMM|nr:LysR substrate-binding domain-containing protein [Thalassotalea sp. W431]MDT0604908.1 LysR substrate-binding domain-containing protein [Thalassotalea sp. W431]
MVATSKAKKLPPLHLLSIFESSARLESFKLASEELFLTPSAVSHQIKSLEEYIGTSLFIRKSRGVKLNSAGKLYLNYIQQGLDQIEQGTKAVKRKYLSPNLKISTFATMATNVILPQLGLFQQAHPEIGIRIETGLDLTDFRYEDFDLAIRIGNGDWPNVSMKKLLDIKVAALCSQEFADKHQLTSIEQIKNIPLIDLTSMDNIWQTWAEAAGLENINVEHNLTFSSYESSLHAAEQGLGLCLALMPIENSLVNRKVLIDPFNKTVPFGRALYAVYRDEDKDRHDIQCFLNWLIKSPNMIESDG